MFRSAVSLYCEIKYFRCTMTYFNFVVSLIRGTLQATSRNVIVYFPIIFHGGCKFLVEGSPRIPRKLKLSEIWFHSIL